MDLICGYKVISQVAIKPSYTTDGVVTYGTAGWSRMLDEKHVGDGPNSVPETQGSISFLAAAAVATSSLKVLVVMAIIGIVAASGRYGALRIAAVA